MAIGIALCVAAGCVPISSNLRMSPSCSGTAAMSGHTERIFALRTYRKPVPIGAYSHLCRLVP